MSLGIEVGLRPGHIVLDEDPAPTPKRGGGAAPNFRLMSIVTKRLDGSGRHLLRCYGGRPRPGHIVLDGDPAPPQKGHSSPLTFRLMFIVAKRSPISASAELLLL